ncbi:MAG: hypothetical protein R3293_27470, partial [Candidatus Promineifilaceae bacterium]|nr:hypothetical protein [Candidatus Promineifilaceae bacterium]
MKSIRSISTDRFQMWPRAYSAFFLLTLAGALLLALGLRPDHDQDAACTTDADAAAARGLTLETVRDLHSNRSLTNREICTMSSTLLERAIVKAGNPKPDHPGEAAAFRRQSLEDEKGQIPPDGYSRAAEHMQRMRALRGNQTMGIDPAAWTWLGPGNIGGRVRALIIHPDSPNQMWAGSVAGGIWKTTDGGASWQPEDDFMANLAVSTLVMDPTNSNTIYAGTGEGFYNSDAIRGAGIFKTTDGGATWEQLPSTATEDFYYVNRLAVSADGSTLLAATRTGIFRSTDGGASWNQRISAIVLDIDFHPADSTKAVAGGTIGGATWFSNDGGITWFSAVYSPPLTGSGRIELAYAPSQPDIVYASVNNSGGQVWKSSDGGQSYTPVHSGSFYLGSQGWYDNIIWVDPTDPNTFIVGGIDLWRSTNGGATLGKISEWSSAPFSAHADHHVIVAHPEFDGIDNKTVFFGNDGGVYKAQNVYTVAGTSGWQELNNNLGITQFYGARGNAHSGVIVGGTQDNGTLRYTGDSESWDEMFGGDGGWSAADPGDPNYFYGEYVYLQIHRSTNGGATSQYIHNGISDAGSCANFIAPFILDPNDANTLLAGGCHLWRSSNVKAPVPTWTDIKPTIPGGRWEQEISAIAV